MTSTPLPTRAGAGRGIALLCAAVAAFACMNAMNKHLASRLPVAEVVWARYASNLVLVTALFAPRMGRRLWRTGRPRIQLVRGALLATSSFLFTSALFYLPMAETSALAFIAPIIIAAMSQPILGERVGPRMWISVMVGFSGVLIVLRPGGAVFHQAALFPLASAAAYALYQILTRKISGVEHPLTTWFYSALVGAAGFGLILPWIWTAPPDLPTAVMLATAGMLGGSGHYMFIRAFESAPPAFLAPLQYTQMIWVVALGYFVFGDFPDPVTMGGIAVIIGAAIVVSAKSSSQRQAE